MTISIRTLPDPLLGLIGWGAFGQLITRHLGQTFRIRVYDPAFGPGTRTGSADVVHVDLSLVAQCPIVLLATPLAVLDDTVRAIAPYLRPGTVVLDVCSVKSIPAAIMLAGLPEHTEIVATHPLFGPQSARGGIEGLKIAVCPVRGRAARRVAGFLRKELGLQVIMTTPDLHDREAAVVQGLTHLIAKVMVEMEPLPTCMTTPSFDLLMQGVNMVRDDPSAVFEAIELSNPHAARVHRQFFEFAAALKAKLENH